MPPQQEEKIKKIFSGSRAFAIVCGNNAGEEVLLAKEALGEALRNAALITYQLPERPKFFSDKWTAILPPAENFSPLYSTSILIPKNRFDTKEISYSDDGKNISINISSAKEEIAKENVVFKTVPAKADAVFYLTSPEKQLITKISLPEEEDKIIVLTALNNTTFSEQVFEIIRTAGLTAGLEKTKVPDLLLASLIAETAYFKNNLNEKTADFLGDLLRLGADKNKVDIMANNKEISFIRLLGRAMARVSPNESLKSLWIFISQQDMEKTGNETADADVFYAIIRKIKELSAPQPFFVLLWQKKEDVFGIISTDRAETAEKLKFSLPAENKNGYLRAGPYKNFTEAELKIQNALKEIV